MKTLRDIGPGDEVAIRHPYRPARIARVERVTKTQIVTSGGDRWRRNDGYMAGGRGFVCLRIEPATDRHRDEVEHQQLVDAIDRVWHKRRDVVAALSLATLRAMAEALEADPAVEAAR